MKKRKKLSPLKALEKIRDCLGKAEFKGFVPESVVRAYKIAERAIKK